MIKRTGYALAGTAALALTAIVAGNASDGARPPRLDYLGEAIIPTGTTFEGTVVGGLSSMAYDAARGVYYALADDQGTLQPARFYTLRIDVGDGTLDAGDVTVEDVTTLLAPDGAPYPVGSLDPEGLTLTRDDELIVTSEGFNAAVQVAPWVRRYALDGTYLADLPVPSAFVPSGPTPTGTGVRQNLGFEAAAVAPNGQHLFVGAEGALWQDGPAASVSSPTSARIVQYHLPTERVVGQYVYVADRVAEPPVPPTAFSVNGLVELLPFNNRFMLAMERSFSVGAPGTGNTIKLYAAAFPRATDVHGIDSLAGVSGIRPVDKTLVLDLRELGIPLDNVEGLTLGPRLPDGRRSLVLVSDNNFAANQFTQFLLFAID